VRLVPGAGDHTDAAVAGAEVGDPLLGGCLGDRPAGFGLLPGPDDHPGRSAEQLGDGRREGGRHDGLPSEREHCDGLPSEREHCDGVPSE
jgi:hypothetical protein